ncbi:c-type cytochrome [Trinickia terrae]|uniref:C-type cytochrome n=1 Tax=Trinickia terrae TaxID=2571161 RepID=A0A4U1HTL4_9BURK|nr:c-type cytochrome [Trinickia terrae]TKC83014.1 c-type cytochrome [Trinickia terrae]
MNRLPFYAAALAAAWALCVPASAEPAPGLALAQQRNCMSCHAEKRPLMGPAFRDVAAKYASRPDAIAYLTRKISDGGAGVWGRVPMPANTQLTPDDAHALATWVLSLK